MAASKFSAFLIACVGALIAVPAIAHAQARDDPSLSIELVDPKVFRVCADPHNLPFSNESGEGFENKIAQLFAGKLDRSVSYAWFPQAVGFLRNTLNAHRCDVVMGFPQGGEIAQSTNPYYRTAMHWYPGRATGWTASTISPTSGLRASTWGSSPARHPPPTSPSTGSWATPSPTRWSSTRASIPRPRA
jgi:hypothetical protein